MKADYHIKGWYTLLFVLKVNNCKMWRREPTLLKHPLKLTIIYINYENCLITVMKHLKKTKIKEYINFYHLLAIFRFALKEHEIQFTKNRKMTNARKTLRINTKHWLQQVRVLLESHGYKILTYRNNLSNFE